MLAGTDIADRSNCALTILASCECRNCREAFSTALRNVCAFCQTTSFLYPTASNSPPATPLFRLRPPFFPLPSSLLRYDEPNRDHRPGLDRLTIASGRCEPP